MNKNGNITTYEPDKWLINSVGDAPAVIELDGTRKWYKDGERHRDGDEPAVIEIDGTRKWYKDGYLHRDGDKPAIILSDSTRKWYKNGVKYTPSL